MEILELPMLSLRKGVECFRGLALFGLGNSRERLWEEKWQGFRKEELPLIFSPPGDSVNGSKPQIAESPKFT